MLKVGIIGAGGVGTTLGGRLLKKGHKVCYGVRDPKAPKYQELSSKVPDAQFQTVPATTDWSDVIFICTPGLRVESEYTTFAESLGSGIKNKVVIDTTNPLSPFPALEVLWDGKSAGEMFAAALPDSFVYKAFNTIGAEQMSHGEGDLITGTQLTMLVAGPTEKKDVCNSIVADVGFIPSYVGPIRYARNLEAIAELWIHLGVPPVGFTREDWGRNFHFQVIKK